MSVTINGNGTITGYTPPIADGSITAAKLASGVGGKVLQIKNINDTSSAQHSNYGGNNYTDMGNLSVNITPSSSSSKILILAHVCCGIGSNSTQVTMMFRVMRDNTPIEGSVTGSQFNAGFGASGTESYSQDGMVSTHFSYVDSPNTDQQITYKVQGSSRSSIPYGYNRSYRTYGGEAKGVSSLSVMEFTP